MILKAYSIKDIYADFANPFFMSNEALAMRTFANLANDDNTVIGRNPECYQLYYLGEFDTETGDFDPVISAEFLCNALAVIRKDGAIDG